MRIKACHIRLLEIALDLFCAHYEQGKPKIGCSWPLKLPKAVKRRTTANMLPLGVDEASVVILAADVFACAS